MNFKIASTAAALLVASSTSSFAGSMVDGKFDPAADPRQATETERSNLTAPADGASAAGTPNQSLGMDPAYKPRAETEQERGSSISTNDGPASDAGTTMNSFDPAESEFGTAVKPLTPKEGLTSDSTSGEN